MHGVEIYKSTTLREKWTRLRHSPDHPLSQRALSRRAAGSYPVFFDRRRAELSRAEPQRIMRERRRQTAGVARSSLHLPGPRLFIGSFGDHVPPTSFRPEAT